MTAPVLTANEKAQAWATAAHLLSQIDMSKLDPKLVHYIHAVVVPSMEAKSRNCLTRKKP